MTMGAPGKLLIVLGCILIVIGLGLHFGIRLNWIGRLPGDVRIERENFSAYFPLGTCLLISAVVSLLLWLFRK